MSFGTYRGLILRSQLIVLLKQRVKTSLSKCNSTKYTRLLAFHILIFLWKVVLWKMLITYSDWGGLFVIAVY